MEIKETIGIDVSKAVIDVCIHSTGVTGQFKNKNSDFKKMISWVMRSSSFEKNKLIFVFEHTGMYSELLTEFLSGKGLKFSIISGLEIKRSLGIVRGKDDKIDAKRIALYAYRRREELTLSKAPKKSMKALKSLHSLRDRLVKQRAGFMASLKEQQQIYSKKDHAVAFKVQKKAIQFLTKQIKELESQINEIIQKDDELHTNFELVTSIKGIGTQTANTLLIYTNNFDKFDSWRKFSSYCGIAPFTHQSGSSIRGRTKVSHLANKQIKSILHMCAITSIQHNPELKKYYDQRTEEGKNKMSTLNVVKNKLVARIFAVIKRKTPYVDTMKFAA